ncbi:menaquinone-dependent protoporphyrinogen IX dehydrogenase [Rhodoplanes azumiensis]|uniref:Menaquinone-dependent protoporphyrinogen IX dehydrogenase n=1 Tax=Rhodoplanes azumiensis TaxID=1897628 RepID=A0ABW5AN33_9BRAD
MQIFYASRDGQSRKIATHVAGRLAARGIPATPTDLATSQPSAADLAAQPLVVAIMSIRYGKHLAEGLQFVETFKGLDAPPPLVLASVNLTARKPGKDTAEGNAYLRKLITKNGLEPALAAAFAGRLDYPRYGFFDRHIIRFIMLITGGPTDPTTVVEYTPWDRVDAFANDIAALVEAGRNGHGG